MNKIKNINESTTATSDESTATSVAPKPQFNFGENDWYPTPNTIFRNLDRRLIDEVLYNNLDIISDYQLFERIKNYESKFNISSEKFYQRWINGDYESRPEFYDWMSIYKTYLD